MPLGYIHFTSTSIASAAIGQLESEYDHPVGKPNAVTKFLMDITRINTLGAYR